VKWPGARRDDEFVTFAGSYGARLRRTAYLLCRDWHLAEDLTQNALARTYVAWGRSGPPDNPPAYAQAVLMNCFLDHKRRRSSSELTVAQFRDGQLPGRASGIGQADLRLTLVEALGTLPPRDRAIVILRYWEDHSIERVAQMLGISVSVVKSQSARSLERLRPLLDPASSLFTP
jgi:RNA polymerase sigma-70 factor (sigma-E family)